MNLLIDTVSSLANIILFNSQRKIIDNISWNIKWNESSTLIPQIDKLLKKNDIKYKDLENMVVINWPGSFTWIRTTILAINSINYIIKKNITWLSFFDLYKSYPIIKSSSKRDCFIKFDKTSDIKIIANNELINILKKQNINNIYWEVDKKIFQNIEILEKIDYKSIIKELQFDDLKQIKALYIKKPNIS